MTHYINSENLSENFINVYETFIEYYIKNNNTINDNFETLYFQYFSLHYQNMYLPDNKYTELFDKIYLLQNSILKSRFAQHIINSICTFKILLNNIMNIVNLNNTIIDKLLIIFVP